MHLVRISQCQKHAGKKLNLLNLLILEEVNPVPGTLTPGMSSPRVNGTTGGVNL